MIKPIIIDFETEGIQRRPVYPPVPVGFSIQFQNERKPKYYAWGHPTGNNCTKQDAKRVLATAWNSDAPLLFQNAKFDVDVAETHMGMKKIPWHRIHDTMFLLFLDDPHAPTHGLKPSSERLLGMPPEEQEAVRDWLVENKVVRRNDARWGRYISKAPGNLVGTYASGDVTRTLKLFQLLYPRIVAEGMQRPYDRERELMPIMLQNEREGMLVDAPLLAADIARYSKAMQDADAWLRKRLKTPELNLDSNEELADALEKCGVVTEFVYTDKGNRSVSKKNLTTDMYNDEQVASVVGYRNRLSTCLNTFMLPWYDMSRADGRIYTNWNQVKQVHSSGDNKGARTGRLSSNPNFMNIPTDFYDKNDGYKHPAHVKALPELPHMRRYILPDKGHVFCSRDYSQQELRILGHYEDGVLCKAFNDTPDMDVHVFVRDRIKEITNKELERRPVKVMNFGMIYGMGIGKLSEDMGVPVEEARRMKAAHAQTIPGLASLDKEIKALARRGEAIRTWGGRVYYCEPPAHIKGRLVTFEYKLLNYLIQGSAADCTKQAIINYDKLRENGRFLVTVHDEINISAPKSKYKREMKLLKEAMESVEFDVPMLSDGEVGPNWHDLEDHDDGK